MFGLNTRMSNGSFGQIALNARSCRSSLVGVWTELGAGRGGRGRARAGARPGRVRGDRRPPARVDYCKDRGLPTDGETLVFKRLTRAALETDRDLVVTTDHSMEEAVPFFALLTTARREIET